MSAVTLAFSSSTGGTVFGYLFLVVGLSALPAILHIDGGTLRILRRRVHDEPDRIAWLHMSAVANRLRRGDSTLIVFFLDRTYARLTLPKARAQELLDLLRSQCPQARITEELPLPKLLEHEAKWRKDPEAFRLGRDDAATNEAKP
ncbi:MAG: hypothetical protein FWD57_01195 [Polyangiaceae bacterium]|nr:hypothetical protein [Polyangiaceae bacterium]